MSGVQKKNENRIAFIAILRWYGAAEKGEEYPTQVMIILNSLRHKMELNEGSSSWMEQAQEDQMCCKMHGMVGIETERTSSSSTWQYRSNS